MSDEDWQSALDAALQAFPQLQTSHQEVAAHAATLRAQGDALPEHLTDLHLAFAAGTGDAAALRLFEDRVLARVDPAVRRIDATPHFIDELRQALRVHLLVSDGDRPPRITEYRARGPLVGWARVAAVRLALNLKRADRPAVSADETLVELAAKEPDPELQHIRHHYRAEFNEALRDALDITSPPLGRRGLDSFVLDAIGEAYAYSYGQELSRLYTLDWTSAPERG